MRHLVSNLFAIAAIIIVLQICLPKPKSGIQWKKQIPRARGMERLGLLSSKCSSLKYLPYTPGDTGVGVFQRLGTHGFIFTSSYRLSSKSFITMGLGALPLHQEWQNRNESCVWVSLKGPKSIRGRLIYTFPGEHHSLTYEVVIISCELEEATTDYVYGGALFVDIQGENTLVYKEEPGEREIEPSKPFKHKLTYCSPLITERIRSERIIEAIQYMGFHGFDYFILYDGGGLESEAMAVLEPLIASGTVEIVDIRGIRKFSLWYNVWTNNNCAYRTRFTSEWTMVAEMEEYIWVQPPNTLLGLLDKYKGKPYITFGNRVWSVEYCRALKGQDPSKIWPIERMQFRWPHFYGAESQTEESKIVLSYPGYRKYILDPRQIRALEIHQSVDPKEGGVDLDTDVAFLNRFEGLLATNALICNHEIGEGMDPEWWIPDASFKDYTQGIRATKKPF